MADKNNTPEKAVPSIQSIIKEYKKQGKELTEKEAESIREQIKKDMASGRLDARNDFEEESLGRVYGGSGGCPIPTSFPPQPDFTRIASKLTEYKER